MLDHLPDNIKQHILSFCDRNTKQILRWTCKGFDIEHHYFNVSEDLPFEILEEIIHESDIDNNLIAVLVKNKRLEELEYFLPKLQTYKYPIIYYDPITDYSYEEFKRLFDMTPNYGKNINTTIFDMRECFRFMTIDKLILILKHYNDFKRRFIEYAPLSGSIEIIEYLLSHGYELNENVFVTAILSKNNNIIEYLLENDCRYNTNVLVFALISNNQEVIEYMTRDGIPNNSYVFDAAVQGNNLSFLRRMYELNETEWCTTKCYNEAVKHDNVEMLDFLFDHNDGFDYHMHPVVIHTAMKHGHIKVIEWLINRGVQLDEEVLEIPIKQDKLEVIKWLISKGYDYKVLNCCLAIRYGYKEMYMWFYDNGYYNNCNVLEEAIKVIDFDLVKRIIENKKELFVDKMWYNVLKTCNFPLIDYFEGRVGTGYLNVTLSGELNLEVIKWLDKKGYKWKSNDYIDICFYEGGIKWLKDRGYIREDFPWDEVMIGLCREHMMDEIFMLFRIAPKRVWSERIFKTAVTRFNLNMLQWFHRNGFPWDETVFDHAAEGDVSMYILNWLYKNNCPMGKVASKMCYNYFN